MELFALLRDIFVSQPRAYDNEYVRSTCFNEGRGLDRSSTFWNTAKELYLPHLLLAQSKTPTAGRVVRGARKKTSSTKDFSEDFYGREKMVRFGDGRMCILRGYLCAGAPCTRFPESSKAPHC